MKYCLLMVLTAVLFSVTDASAAGNAEDLQKKFSKQVLVFYDMRDHNRGMMPLPMLDPHDKPVTLDDYKGRFVILHFWASWCPPCIAELPKLKAFADKKAGKDLAVVVVSLDYAAPYAKIDKFMKSKNLVDFPSFRVPAGDKAWDQLTAFGLPGTFLINPKGQILYKLSGENDWTSPATNEFIDHLLANQTK